LLLKKNLSSDNKPDDTLKEFVKMQQEERNKGKLSRAKINILNGICQFPWKDDDYQFDLNVWKMYNCYFFNNEIYTDDVYEW